jgi:hypothetical protein
MSIYYITLNYSTVTTLAQRSLEIRSTIFSCPEPQIWNSPITKEYIAYWKLHASEILEVEDYAYYEEYDEDYDFDEEAIHNLNT